MKQSKWTSKIIAIKLNTKWVVGGIEKSKKTI